MPQARHGFLASNLRPIGFCIFFFVGIGYIAVLQQNSSLFSAPPAEFVHSGSAPENGDDVIRRALAMQRLLPPQPITDVIRRALAMQRLLPPQPITAKVTGGSAPRPAPQLGSNLPHLQCWGANATAAVPPTGSREKVWLVQTQELVNSLSKFDLNNDGSWDPRELDAAYQSKDQWGQYLKHSVLPDRDVLMAAADTNHDGILSGAEALSWNGTNGLPCRNYADQHFGCTRRCTSPVEGLFGEDVREGYGYGSYFSGYGRCEIPQFESSAVARAINPKNHGAMSHQQWRAIAYGINFVLEKKLPGAIAEFGVFHGGTSRSISMMLRDAHITDRHLHLYDSFSGLPKCDRDRDSGMCEEGAMNRSLDEVKRVLSEFQNIHYHVGVFQDLTLADMPDQIAIAFLDGDLYQSIKNSFDLVYPRLVPGGVVFIHDYGFEGYPGTELAMRDVLANRPEKVMLPAFAGEDGFVCYLGMVVKQ